MLFQQYFSYIAAASAPMYAFLELLFHITIVETTDSGERGMNPVAITIISPRKILAEPGDRTSDLLFSSRQLATD